MRKKVKTRPDSVWHNARYNPYPYVPKKPRDRVRALRLRRRGDSRGAALARADFKLAAAHPRTGRAGEGRHGFVVVDRDDQIVGATRSPATVTERGLSPAVRPAASGVSEKRKGKRSASGMMEASSGHTVEMFPPEIVRMMRPRPATVSWER